VVARESHIGSHADHLSEMSNALLAFNKDLTALGLSDRVTLVTFSEFGRKPSQNGNLGTDHGSIAPMFIVGDHVRPGIIGKNPDLSNLDETNHFKELGFDYRRVFSGLLQDWMGADKVTLKATGLEAFRENKLSLINKNCVHS